MTIPKNDRVVTMWPTNEMSRDGITFSHYASGGSLEYLGVAIISVVSDLNVEEALKNAHCLTFVTRRPLKVGCGNLREIGVFPASPHKFPKNLKISQKHLSYNGTKGRDKDISI
jgi:hypothetical protein